MPRFIAARKRRAGIRGCVLAALSACLPAAAGAHPHQWVDVASEVVFGVEGRIEAVRHHWRFDEGFTAFALQGLDADGDGAYSAEELKPLAQENVESLIDYDYFTFITTGDYRAGFAAPKDYRIELDAGLLTLHFTLPLAQPLFSRSTILLQVYDPEYYIAFSLPSPDAVRLVGAPAECRLDVFPAQGPDAAAAAALSEVGADQRALPEDMQALATGIDNSAEIRCGGAPSTGGAAADAHDAGEALAELAAGQGGDLRALPANPPGADAAAPPPPDPPPPAARARPAAPPEPPDGFAARVGALQAAFNHRLTEALKSLKADGSAFWWLGGVSFLYGIIHAAGPGHGKAVISSYLLANEERLRRGIVIAFLSAFLQALVAIGIVAIMAAVLGMTSMAMTRATGLLETGSFALVALLGLYLLVRKGRAAWTSLQGGDLHAGHSHAHAPHAPGAVCSCGHHHHAAPEAVARPGLPGALAAVASVGLRPCTGALVVLVFALAQGIFWAGIASTLLMALGTALTVSALAGLAVGAKGVALRLARGDGRRSGQVMLGLELAAALFIAALGGVLFVGSLQA